MQLKKLKSGIKNGTKMTLKISSNVVGESNDENNFPRKAFTNGSSANIKLSKVSCIK